ncbi:WYL domain-containing protein [Olsenella uli]|uniref:WYL domain-containing protein n=1 Tax=Olsenella uli TaxID=133926 RepID=UPI0019594879|nr:WYL domain-containing protein [Olsenella uli]MBM6816889.1 WYL domain-containing protein [Olsenella uli]
MPRRESRAGRTGAVAEARELVALVSSLSEAGDALSAEAVAARLGTTAERAEKLIGLVETSSSAGGVGLPLTPSRDGEATLAFSGGVRGRRLRLTRTETVALAAALERLGVGADDPLRARLEGALAAEPVSEDVVRRVVAAGAGACSETISACARSLLKRRELSFSYRGAADEAAQARSCVPRGLRCEGDVWYLDAYDLERCGERTFRLDRMEDVLVGGRAAAGNAAPGRQTSRAVEITFSDRRYLDLLPWHDLRVARVGEDGSVIARTEYYGGMWLPRMIAACGGAARTTDAEVTRLAADYARALLSAGRSADA